MTALPFLEGESRTRILGGGEGGRRVGEDGLEVCGGVGFRGVDFRTERMLILVFGGGMYSCVMSRSTGTGTSCSWNRSTSGSLIFGGDGDGSRTGEGCLMVGGTEVYLLVPRFE